jgi:hypothetical protein
VNEGVGHTVLGGFACLPSTARASALPSAPPPVGIPAVQPSVPSQQGSRLHAGILRHGIAHPDYSHSHSCRGACESESTSPGYDDDDDTSAAERAGAAVAPALVTAGVRRGRSARQQSRTGIHTPCAPEAGVTRSSTRAAWLPNVPQTQGQASGGGGAALHSPISGGPAGGGAAGEGEGSRLVLVAPGEEACGSVELSPVDVGEEEEEVSGASNSV